MKLSAEQNQLIAHYNEDQKKAFEKLSDADKTAKLEMLAKLRTPAKTTAKMVEANVDTKDDYVILSPADLQAGQVINARLLGTKSMFSTEKKENWADDIVEGRKVYLNHHFVFENLETGEKFGIFSSPTLNRILTKIRTKASFEYHRGEAPAGVINPEVSLTYIGLIEGKERLATEFDLQIQGGDKAHVFSVQVQEGVVYDIYESGVVNWVNDPLPNFGTEAKLDGVGARQRDLARLQGPSAETGTRQVEGGQPAQIGAPTM